MSNINDTTIAVPFVPVTARLEKAAAKEPGKTAVVCREDRISYRDFNETVNRAAHSLLEKGLKKEDIVAVMADRSIDAYVGQWAVLKAGGAFVFISPSYPEDRVRFILEDSGAKFILKDEYSAGISKSWEQVKGCPTLMLDELKKNENKENPDVGHEASDLCYCIYTSGSTGHPKGVMIEHGNLANFVDPNEKNRETTGITGRAHVVLAIAALTFDFSLMEEYIPLTNGLTVVLATDEEIHDPVMLSRQMEKNGVDCMMGTPSYFAMLLEIPQAKKALQGIVSYDLGAEAFPPGLCEKLTKASPNAYIMNGYGPTEATISCTMKVVESDEGITIGVPSANVYAYIIDEKNEEVPEGEMGELLICGAGVGRGYINLPDKTAEVFITFRGMRGYKTGDLARIDGNGEIEFHGRRDNQVKLRGLRIELGEIEEVISSYPAITNVAVIVAEDRWLCAYYTGSEEIDEDELREYAGERLAHYMMPDFLIQLEEMPLTDNHKIDKKALPRPVIGAREDGGVPKNSTQQKIHDILADITGSDAFGIATPFSHAGLTSLGAMQMNVRLADAFGVVIKTSDIFEYDTIEKMERYIGEAGQSEVPKTGDVSPLTGSQEGIFAVCDKNPDSTIYNIPFLFRLEDGIDTDRLVRALEETVAAHPYLNAHFFVGEDGNLSQKMGETDFSAAVKKMTDADFAKEKNSLVRPFRLTDSRMYRIEIYLTDTAKYLFTDFHHILADGNSYDIFFEDLDRAYRGEELSEEDYSGFDVATEEAYYRQQGRYRKAAKYYDDTFSGLEIESLPIPDRREETPKKGLMNRPLKITEEKVKELCEDMAVTPNTLFTGIFGIVAARFAGEKEALFATIYNGRNDSRLEHTMCMLVKTLPVYTRFDAKTRLNAYLSELQEQLMQSMANDIYPFSEIAAKYGISSDLIFAYQAELTDDYPIGDTMALGEDLSLDQPKEPLLLQVRLRDGVYVLEAEYRADMYSGEMIESILSSYDTAMTSAASAQRAADITILDPGVRDRMDEWNKTETDYDRSATVVSLIEKSAAAYPGHIACVFEDRQVSYREMDAWSDRIAAYLIDQGIGRGSVVSIMIPRHEVMIMASVGVLKTGACYQPLDATYPSERLTFMAGDSGAAVLITTEELRGKVTDYDGKVMLLDLTKPEGNWNEALPDARTAKEKIRAHRSRMGDVEPGDIFTLLYTSGTTGKPKGVRLTHGNLVCFLAWYERYFDLTADDAVGAYASYGFDANMMDMYTPLSVGATCVIVPEEMRLDIEAMSDYLEKAGVTHMFMTTQVGRQFAENTDNKSIRHLSAGGEALPPIEPPKNYAFYNGYGPTECTIYSTVFKVDKKYANNPIGKPLDNIKLYVTDGEGHRLPPGAAGELLITGPHVAAGYLNRPDKTAEVFVHNPFVSTDSEYYPAYRSGDVVRFLTDGNIEFIGRRDGQVKIRGFRIELSEVESVIRESGLVKDVAVAAFDNPGGGKYIAAYVVTKDGGEADAEAIRQHILAEKPPYMVPEVIQTIEAIPLNQNGKVNRRALPEPVHKAENIIPPKNETQQKIFDCVAEAIGHREFGITTDITCAGLTSITSIRLNVLLSKAFDVSIRSTDLKENPTVEMLERFLLGAGKVETHEKQEVYPMGSSQEGVFVDCMANNGTTVYNIPYLFRLSDNVDITRVKKALEQVVDAHPYLKVRLFMDEDGEIRQRRMDDERFEVPILTDMDKDRLVRPFSLLNGSLLRIELYREHDGCYLFLDVHHLVADGTSVALLLEDLERAYAGEELAGEKYTAYDLALDQAHLKAEGAYEKAEAFYDETFPDAGATTDIPFDRSDDAPSVKDLKMTMEDIAPEVTKLCERYRITENVFFVSAFGLMLSRYHFADKAVFTTIYHGRNDAKLSDTVGMLVKTLPVVVRLEEEQERFFTAVKQELMGLMDADIYPYSEAAKKYGFAPNTMFVYQGDSFDFDRICGEKAEEIPLKLNAAKEPVSVMVSRKGDSFVCEYEYRGDLYEEETIEYLSENYLTTVKALLAGEAPGDVRLPFDEEETMRELPGFAGRTIVDLFGKSVESYPDRIAVKDDKGSISYAELDRASDYVTGRLAADGFGPETVAGILCGRVKEFMVGVFGIMKAGGAYVPLDPDYPKDRILYMLEDSGSTHLLAQKELLDIAGDYKGHVVLLDDIVREAMESDAARSEVKKAGPENLAYMIYTSGSTGKPKGVELTHANLMNLLQQVTIEQSPTEKDMYALFSSFCFDASVHDMFIPYTCGASLYIFPADSRQDVMKVCEVFEKEPITVTSMPTQMGELAIDMFSDKVSLRIITLGGEKFKRFHEDRKFIMFNGYGPTENTVSTSSFVVDREYRNIPIGKSHINVRSYILDDKLQRVPVGAPGELCLSGRQLARGYHNLPEKTAAAFVTNPYAKDPDESRLYHTGDMVRKKGDGNMEYIGRIDSQVKIRGYRVELGEIEGAILGREGVGEAAVIASETNGVMNLTAYYTGSEYTEADWKDYLAPLLPDYMMPAFIMHLDSMPVTPGGKIDKKALPKPEMKTDSTYVAPQTSVQKKLCEIFAKALGLERVGIEDDFFAMGGSSLAASKVAVMCLAEEIEIVYADIFKHPTVKELSGTISGGKEEQSRDEFADYDYGKIDMVLSANDIRNVDQADRSDIGDILLTGATGFLGIHVLKHYLDHYEGTAYCLVRKGTYESPEKRLKHMLMYYFENPHNEMFEKRIRCIDGDITEEDEVMGFAKYDFDTLINCAACVKHFSAGDLLERINVTGVKHLVRLCKETKRRLIHISTVSVAGEGMDGTPPVDRRIMEKDLYFGQSITNEYIRTKFLSERVVLQAVTEGLDAKVIRVGNLMSRESDGEFQINFITNGFLRSLRGYKTVEAFPIGSMGESTEFSPIDSTAEAVLTLAQTGSRFTVFHATNSHRIYMSDVIRAMREYGFEIDIVSDEEFAQRLNDYAKDHEESESVSGLIAYASHDANHIYGIDYDNTFTVEMLYRLGYLWPITDSNYLKSAISALAGLTFFEEE